MLCFMIACRPNFNEKQVGENEKIVRIQHPLFVLTSRDEILLNFFSKLGHVIVRRCVLDPLVSSNTLGHANVWVLAPVRKIMSFDICDINMVGTLKGNCVNL